MSILTAIGYEHQVDTSKVSHTDLHSITASSSSIFFAMIGSPGREADIRSGPCIRPAASVLRERPACGKCDSQPDIKIPSSTSAIELLYSANRNQREAKSARFYMNPFQTWTNTQARHLLRNYCLRSGYEARNFPKTWQRRDNEPATSLTDPSHQAEFPSHALRLAEWFVPELRIGRSNPTSPSYVNVLSQASVPCIL